MDTYDIINSEPSKKKIDEKEYSMMMHKFNQLNKHYNENSFEHFINENLEYKYDILNLKDEDFKYFMDKAKYELTKIKLNMKNTREEIQKYNGFLESINNFIKCLETTNSTFHLLVTQSKFINIKNKSLLTNEFNLCEKDFLINDIKDEIETKIESLNELLYKDLKLIVRFKQLLLKSYPEEKFKNYCNICSTNKINICLNPCGHTFCLLCVDNMNKCGMCRANITSKIKLYIDESQEDDNLDNEIEPFNGYNNIFASTLENI